MMKVGIVGAGGYAGGELLRLLLGHPDVREVVAGSESLAGKPVTTAHPNLRKRTGLQFVHYEDVTGCDVVFLSLPNGTHRADEFEGRAKLLIDLSSDHRLKDAADYERWYGVAHPYRENLGRWVYGIPELHRAQIRGATHLTGAGCNATATILARGSRPSPLCCPAHPGRPPRRTWTFTRSSTAPTRPCGGTPATAT